MHCCPECSSSELKIDVSFTGQVACRFGTDGEFELIDRVALDSQWHDESMCECLSCNWNGTVGNTRPQSAPEQCVGVAIAESDDSVGALTAGEMQELMSLMEAEACSPALRKQVERLAGEVERLGSLLDTMMRITGNSAASDGDTLLG